MKKSIPFVFYIFLLSCNSNQELSNDTETITSKIDLTPVSEFQISNTNALIGNIRVGFQVSHQNSLYAFEDTILNNIIVTDTTGKVLAVVGGKGRGPKEFLDISSFGFDSDNNVIVYDALQSLIKVLDLDNEIVHTIDLQPEGFNVATPNLISIDNKIYFGIIEIEYLNKLKDLTFSNILVEINENGKSLKKFGNYDSLTPESNLYSVFPTSLAYDFNTKSIFTVQKNSFILQAWNINNNKRSFYTTKKPPSFNFSTEILQANLPFSKIIERGIGQSSSQDVYVTNNFVCLYYVTLAKNSKNTQRYLAFYDKEGNFMSEIKLNHKLVQAHDNFIYLLENDDPENYQLKKYEINYLP